MSTSERIDPVPHVIELVDISKLYRTGDIEVAAVREVSLTIDVNEFVAVVGPSGSGKSTLMHILGCLDLPTSGRFLLAGHDVATLDEDQLADVRNVFIGFVFQQFNLLAYLPRLAERRAAARLRPRAARPNERNGPWPPSPRSASPTGHTTGRASCPAASSSASPSPAPSSPSRR